MDWNIAGPKYLWVLVLSAFLAGCGGAAISQAPSTTDLLLQSGFQPEAAKSPDHFQKLPGNQFVVLQRQGGNIYVYTDPQTNQLYFGSESAYLRYKVKAAEAKAAEVQPELASQYPKMSAFDWAMYAHLHGVGP
jgi:hypothetical protein